MNYLAVVVAAVATMVVGFLWYGPLFGKLWLKGMKFSAEQIKNMKKAGMQKSMPGMVVSALLMSFVLAKLFEMFSITTIIGGATLVLWIWLGFCLTIQFGTVLWEGKSSTVFLVNSTYNLVNLLVLSTVLLIF